MSKKRTIRKLRARNKELLKWCYDWQDIDKAHKETARELAQWGAKMLFYSNLMTIKAKK